MHSPPTEDDIASIPYVDDFMLEALKEAQCALEEEEVPVGAVIVPLSTHQQYWEYAMRERGCSMTDKDKQDGHLPQTMGTRKTGLSASGSSLSIRDGRCAISRGRNATNRLHHALAHAEFICVEDLLRASRCGEEGGVGQDPPRELDFAGEHWENGITDLSKYVLYVTVEPCIMCAAFLRYNRIAKVFFGCPNVRFGGNGSVLSLQEPNPGSGNPKGMASGLNGGEECGDGEGMSEMNSTLQTLGYFSEGDHRAQEAIELLQKFYMKENPNAPDLKRKRKSAAPSPHPLLH